MSDIKRFVTIWGGGGMMPASSGDWVRYDDHRAEVERLMADVVKLRIDLNSVQVAANQLRGEVERLTAERDEARGEVERVTARQAEMETHITGLTAELHRTRADGIELRWVEGEVEQLTAQRDAAQAEVERLKELLDQESKSLPKLIDSMTSQLRATADRVTAERDAARVERDAAQRERERVQDLLTLAGRELSTLRETLRVRRRDQSAQNLDMANGQATLDTSRPDDETIWREAFMRFIEEKNAVECADIALAEYRKRWPR